MGGKRKIEKTLSAGRETVYTSELGKLSSDPTITKHPDPEFHLRFTDPDELGDEEPVEFTVSSTITPRRAYPTHTDGLLRRSPKE
jgi:hypothetical protein